MERWEEKIPAHCVDRCGVLNVKAKKKKEEEEIIHHNNENIN